MMANNAIHSTDNVIQHGFVPRNSCGEREALVQCLCLSDPILEPKRLERISPGSSQSRQIRGDERHAGQKSRHHTERDRVRGLDPVQQRGHEARESDGRDESDCDADDGEDHALSQDHPAHVTTVCAESHSHTYFPSTLAHDVRDDPIDPNQAESEGNCGRDGKHD